MIYKTGQTIYDLVLSLDMDNIPVIETTFEYTLYNNGVVDNTTVFDIILTDEAKGMFTVSFSASTFGSFQYHLKNNSTGVIFISNTFLVKPDTEVDPSPTIYVGY
jgi:hypothetical protein